MTLIKSISGIRGTIGGQSGDNLTPIDIVKFASAFGQWIFSRTDGCRKVVIEMQEFLANRTRMDTYSEIQY